MAVSIDRYINRYGIAVCIVAVNVAVFVLQHIAMAFVGRDVLHFVEFPALPAVLLTRPWTVLTYMVAQTDVFHLLINMLWFYCFARFLQDVVSPSRIVWLYAAGGVGGALMFMATWPFHGGASWLIGASAAVVAVVAATAIMMPYVEVGFLFVGPLRLKWIAWITIALDMAGLFGANPGAHLAHAGGLIAGIAVVMFWRYAPKSRSRSRKPAQGHEERLDCLLDKVHRSGFSSLTLDERRELMRLSQNHHRN